MRCMSLARSSRSVIALATALLLFLCQTAFALQACAHFVDAASSTSAGPPCHETANAAHTGVPLSAGACDTKAVGDYAKVTVWTLADLPAIPVTYSETDAPVASTGAPPVVHAVCYSPPLSILHCRLLN